MLANSLKKWDTIWIISPSNCIVWNNKVLLENAIKKFKNFWFKVVLSKNCLKIDKYEISGWEPQERANDLNEMFANPEINVIYCFQWWNTANQILSLIDYETIKKNPKIFLWMSDIDVLLLAIHKKTSLITFHWSDPKSWRNMDLDFEYTWNSFQNRMIKKSKDIIPTSSRISVREWVADGKIIGCNLSSILKLAWTPYFPDFDNSILFLEWYNENILTLIYKLQQLKEIWVFEKINWIVIGYVLGFQNKEFVRKNNIKVKYEDIVLDITTHFRFEICILKPKNRRFFLKSWLDL